MDEAIFPGENFHERAEFLGGNNPTVISRADLDLACHPPDDFLRARHCFAAAGVDMNRTVVLDINLSAGFGDDALDRFAALPDKAANLLGINFDGLDPRRVSESSARGLSIVPRMISRILMRASFVRWLPRLESSG